MKVALRADSLEDPSVIVSVTSVTQMLAQFGHVRGRRIRSP